MARMWKAPVTLAKRTILSKPWWGVKKDSINRVTLGKQVITALKPKTLVKMQPRTTPVTKKRMGTQY